MKWLAPKLIKLAYFFFLSLIISRTTGNPDTWMSDDLSNKIGHFLYGEGEIGADNFYELHSYVSIIIIFSITALTYYLTMKLIKKIRRR